MAHKLALDDAGRPIQLMARGGAPSVSVGATSARTSSAITAGERIGAVVSVTADTDCYIAVGDDTVTATTSDHRLNSGERREFVLPVGELYIAAIRDSADGTLWISELTGP